MPREYTFTTRNYPVNDLWELDLQNHMDQMAGGGWSLVCTQNLIYEDHQATPKMMLFWSRGQTF